MGRGQARAARSSGRLRRITLPHQERGPTLPWLQAPPSGGSLALTKERVQDMSPPIGAYAGRAGQLGPARERTLEQGHRRKRLRTVPVAKGPHMCRAALALAVMSGTAFIAACQSREPLQVEPSMSLLDGSCPDDVREDPEYSHLDCNPLDAINQRPRVRAVFGEISWRWSDERCGRIGSRFMDDESKWWWDTDEALGGQNLTLRQRYTGYWYGTSFTPVTFLLDGATFAHVVGHEAAHADGYEDETAADRVSQYCTKQSHDPPWGYES